MPKRHYAGTSRGGPIVATRRDVIVECGQVLEENRRAACLHVDREVEKEKEKKEEEREVERKRRNDDEARRCERIADN